MVSDEPVEKNNGFVARWGPVVGLIGGLLGAVSLVLSLLDRFTPLRLQLCEVIPMCIQAPSLHNDPHISVFGIGAVVRCRASSKTVFISGLDYLGKKMLSVSEYLPDGEKKKTSRKEIELEVARNKPFERVEWNGWPQEGQTAARLEPYEEKYIKFIFLEPTPFYYVQEGGSPHIGYDALAKEPERIRTKPSLYDIFKLRLRTTKDEKDGSVWSIWSPHGLRDDVAAGRLNFGLE